MLQTMLKLLVTMILIPCHQNERLENRSINSSPRDLNKKTQNANDSYSDDNFNTYLDEDFDENFPQQNDYEFKTKRQSFPEQNRLQAVKLRLNTTVTDAFKNPYALRKEILRCKSIESNWTLNTLQLPGTIS